MSSFYSRYLKAVHNGFEETKIRVVADRSLPQARRTMAWELSTFIRLDRDFLPDEGASPHAMITFQQVSSTLSELIIRRLLKDDSHEEILKQTMERASLLFEVYLEKLEHEIVEEEVRHDKAVGDDHGHSLDLFGS